MKKKILIALAVILVVGAAVAFPFLRYMWDPKDTEELFRQNVASVGYQNTVESALPQTELYNTVKFHFESPLEKGKTEKKAIILGYDGCRADILVEMDEANSGIAALKNEGGSLNLYYCGGVNYPAENTQATSTAPGWCSMLTGVWSDVHGITGNGITKDLEPKTLMISLVEDEVIDDAAFITKWKGHFSRDGATYNTEKAYCEENDIDVDFNLRKGLKDVHTGAMEEITSDDCADFVLIIYENTDSAGHDFGFTFNNPVYKDGFRTEDAYGYEVIKAIEARETYDTEDWLIIVTSDHGGIGTGHGGPSIQERMNFVVMNKKWD